MNLVIIYEDDDVLIVDKPAGLIVFPEGTITGEKTLIDFLIEKYPTIKMAGEAPRYGIVHRLDKDTSGLLLVAKTTEALIFLQKKFITRELEKKYLALVCGQVKDKSGDIHTLIGRSKSDPRKQTAHSINYTGKTGLREAITSYQIKEHFQEYTLLEVQIKTGRRHQIRCHLAYIKHPIAGDTLYTFKDSPKPMGLTRQFLHASYIKIQLPSGKVKEFKSDLPIELKSILNNLGK